MNTSDEEWQGVPFVDVEQVLIVEGDRLVSFNCQGLTYPAGRSWSYSATVRHGRHGVGGKWWLRRAWACSSQQRVLLRERLVLRFVGWKDRMVGATSRVSLRLVGLGLYGKDKYDC